MGHRDDDKRNRLRVRRPPNKAQRKIEDTDEWFRKLDELASESLLPGGRKQPAAPGRDVFE